MNRRGLIGSVLALCAAPAIVRADSLMRVVARDTTILVPPLFGLHPYPVEHSLAQLLVAADSIKYPMNLIRDVLAESEDFYVHT